MVGLDEAWVQKAVASAAKAAARKHEGYAEISDFMQEGNLYLMENPELLDEDSGKGRGYLQRAVYYAMNQYGMKQRYSSDGTKPDDYFRYTSYMAEELIGEALDGVPSVKSPSAYDDSPASNKSPSETGDRNAMVADIRQAFVRLNEKDQNVLSDKFLGGDISSEVLALTYGISPEGVDKRIKRALVRLAKALNGDYSPHQKRRVVPNMTSQVWTNKYWNER